MNAAELKTELEKLGWQFAPNHFNTGVDWCAYTALEGALDCTSNKKPPSLFITPWQIISYGVGDTHRSVEFEVCGAAQNDVWLKFKIYSVKMDDALATIPTAKAILLARGMRL